MAPLHPHREYFPMDHVDYEFEEILDDLYNGSLRRKMNLLERYPELFALSYSPCAYSLAGSFFHHRVRRAGTGKEDYMISLSHVETPSPVVVINWYAFFSCSDPLPVPTLKEFLACANVYSRNYEDGPRQYQWLPVDDRNRRRVPNVCYLLPSVAMLYLNQPSISPLWLLHHYLKHIFDRMPEDNAITLGTRNIVLREGEAFPDGAYYDPSYAQPYYPSILFLWYYWKKSFLRNPSNLNVSRTVSTNVLDQEWCRIMHKRWLF